MAKGKKLSKVTLVGSMITRGTVGEDAASANARVRAIMHATGLQADGSVFTKGSGKSYIRSQRTGLLEDAETVNARAKASRLANEGRIKAAEASGKKFLKPWEVIASLDAKKGVGKKLPGGGGGPQKKSAQDMAAKKQTAGHPVEKSPLHLKPLSPRKKPKDLSYSSALSTAKLHVRKMLHAAGTGGSEAFSSNRQQAQKQFRAAGVGHAVKGAGMKAATPHTLQRGKKGGTFYIANGKKVYAKK